MVIKTNNLKRIIEHLKTIDETKFTMVTFSNNINSFKTEDLTYCNTAGCVIGHSIILDVPLFKRLEIKAIQEYSNITGEAIRQRNIFLFSKWSEEFTGISQLDEEWNWCFGSEWNFYDNSISGAISRIEALIDNKITEHKHYSDFKRFLLL